MGRIVPVLCLTLEKGIWFRSAAVVLSLLALTEAGAAESTPCGASTPEPAASLREGLEETLGVSRLGLSGALRRTRIGFKISGGTSGDTSAPMRRISNGTASASPSPSTMATTFTIDQASARKSFNCVEVESAGSGVNWSSRRSSPAVNK